MKPNPNQAGQLPGITTAQPANKASLQDPVIAVENVRAPGGLAAERERIANGQTHPDLQVPSAPIFTSGPLLRLRRPDRLLLTRSRFQHQPTFAGEPDLDQILAAWDLRLDGPARKAGSPGRSRNWLIPSKLGLKILKLYKPSLDRDWVIHEHSILQALAAADFPAPRLVTAEEGTLIEREGRIFALFEAYEGYFHYHNSIFLPGMVQKFVSAAGRTLAVLHQTLRDYIPRGRNPNGFMTVSGDRWRELDWYFSRLERIDRGAPSPPAVFSAVTPSPSGILTRRSHAITTGWLRERLVALDEALKDARLERVIAHGDYGPYNLLFRQGSPVVVLDFELARLDWRLTDLSAGLFYFTHGRAGFNWKKMSWFLDAYRSVTTVSPHEMHYLPLVWQFLTMRRVIVLWERLLDGSPGTLQEAQERMSLLNWLIRHEEDLRNL